MEILKSACAGTMESSDAYVEIEPGAALAIYIESVVKKQFGDRIELAVREVLAEHGGGGLRDPCQSRGRRAKRRR